MKNVRLQATNLLWLGLLRPYLFDRDPETAHRLAVELMATPQEHEAFLKLVRLLFRSPRWNQPLIVGGVPWRSPVGLAAGFDKQGELVPLIDAIGFGNEEVGTVTPYPQLGNELPRVWRYPDKLALANRYGFPSEGAAAIAERLRRTFGEHDIGMSVTVSIGPNKSTPPTQWVDDFAAAYWMIRPALRRGDGIKINVSSPNTPGLRDAFKDLRAFLQALHCRLDDSPWPLPPLAFKVPPDDLTPEQYVEIIGLAAEYGFGAVEATNTSNSAASLAAVGHTNGVVGISGAPIFAKSNEVLSVMREPAQQVGIDLIGVGGIMSGADALTKRARGAKAVQGYTGFVYRGWYLLHEMLEAMSN